MATYIELQKQIESLQREADEMKSRERKGVIARMKEAIAAYGISAVDLGLVAGRGRKPAAPAKARKAGRKGRRTGAAAAVAFSDPQGNTWGGRGKRPNWLREALANGAKLEDFAVKK